MPFTHGKSSAVSVAGTLLTAYLDSTDLSIDVDTSETSTFGNAWKNNIVGQAGGNISLKGMYDATAGTGPAVVLEGLIGAAASAIIYYPGGNTAGQRKYTFNALLTSYKESSSVGGKVTFEASLLADGQITPATI